MTAHRCPRCWNGGLRPVQAAGKTNFLCPGCNRCWRPEQGYLVEVNPYACSGCEGGRPCSVR